MEGTQKEVVKASIPVIGEIIHRTFDEPERCSAELGEASNRWKIYFNIHDEEKIKAMIEEVKHLQDYAVEIGAAPGPKPPKQVKGKANEEAVA